PSHCWCGPIGSACPRTRTSTAPSTRNSTAAPVNNSPRPQLTIGSQAGCTCGGGREVALAAVSGAEAPLAPKRCTRHHGGRVPYQRGDRNAQTVTPHRHRWCVNGTRPDRCRRARPGGGHYGGRPVAVRAAGTVGRRARRRGAEMFWYAQLWPDQVSGLREVGPVGWRVL